MNKSVGIITYDLQAATAATVSRLADALEAPTVAYPVLNRVDEAYVRFSYRRGLQRGRCISIHSDDGVTREGLLVTANIASAILCAVRSRVVVLYGLHGATAMIAAAIGRLLGRGVVAVHQTLPLELERRRRWWVRGLKWALVRLCSVHVAQTPSTRATLRSVYGVADGAIVDAPFEAGVEQFRSVLAEIREARAEVRTSLGIGADEVVFLFVGTMLKMKGLELLLQAFRDLVIKRSAKCRLILVGPQSPRNGEWTVDEWRSAANVTGVGSYVDVAGERTAKECARYYRAADVFVLPSFRDTWGKVLAEAALARLPIIATDACGAAGTLVVDGVNGYVVPAGNVGALEGAMERLMETGRRQSMGEESLHLVVRATNETAEVDGLRSAIRMAMSRTGAAK